MKQKFFSIVVFLVLGALGLAVETLSNCVDGDSNTPLFKVGNMPKEAERPEGGRFPEVGSENDTPGGASLKWVAMPEGVSGSVSVLGHFQGHEILELTYTDKIRGWIIGTGRSCANCWPIGSR